MAVINSFNFGIKHKKFHFIEICVLLTQKSLSIWQFVKE